MSSKRATDNSVIILSGAGGKKIGFDAEYRIYEGLPIAYQAIDPEGRILHVNKSWSALMGYSREEAVGKVFDDILTPESLRAFEDRADSLVESGQLTGCRLEMVRGDETHVHVVMDCTAASDSKGRLRHIHCFLFDVTEYVDETRRLTDNLTKYQIMVDTQVEAVCRWRPDTTLTFVNEGYCKSFGKAKDELVGTKWIELVPEDSRSEVADFYRSLAKDPRTYTYEHKVIGAGGRIRWQQWTDTPVFEGGRFVGFQSVGRDVTERKLAEEALRESEDKYRSIFDNALVGIFKSTVEGKLVEVNPAMARMFGYESPKQMLEEVTDTREQLYVPPESRDRMFDLLYESGGNLSGLEVTFRRRDGSVFTVNANVSMLEDGKGNPSHIEGFIEDITERKLLQQVLRDNEEKFRGVFEESPVGIALYDSQGRLVEANKSCLRIFGVENVSEIMGFRLLEDPNLAGERKEKLLSGLAVKFDLRYDFERVREQRLYETKRTGYADLELFIKPLSAEEDEQVRGYVVFIRDVTESRKAVESLTESEEKYRTSFQALSKAEEELRGRVLSLESQLAGKAGEAARLGKELDETRSKLHLTAEELQRAGEGIRGRDEELGRTRADLQRTSEGLRAKDEELAKAYDELRVASEESATHVRANEELQKERDSLLSANRKLEKDCADYSTQVLERGEELDKTKAELQRTSEGLRLKDEELAKAYGELRGANEEAASQVKVCEELQTAVASLASENDGFKREVSESKSRLQEMDELARAKEKLEHMVQERDGELARAKEKLEHMVQERDGELAQAEEGIRNLQAELERVSEELGACKGDLQSTDERLALVDRENARLHGEFETTKAQTVEVVREKDDELKKTAAELEKTRGEAERERKAKEELLKNKAHLEGELRKKDEELAGARTEFNDSLKSKDGELAKTAGELQRTAKARDELHRIRVSLEGQLKTKNEELGSARDELHSLREDMEALVKSKNEDLAKVYQEFTKTRAELEGKIREKVHEIERLTEDVRKDKPVPGGKPKQQTLLPDSDETASGEDSDG